MSENLNVYGNVRIKNMHDTEQGWCNVPQFVPERGELIIYDEDEFFPYRRAKIGDGVTTIVNLPFITRDVHPKVMLVCKDADMSIYSKTFTTLSDRSLKATVALSVSPGLFVKGLSYYQFRELIDSGWDWVINTDYFDLQSDFSNLATYGLFNPIGVLSGLSQFTESDIEVLKSNGIRVAVCCGDSPVGAFSKSVFTIEASNLIDSNITDVLSVIDTNLKSSKSVCINITNVSSEEIVSLADALVTRVNQGMCDVCTLSEFYSIWEPSDCISYLLNRNEKFVTWMMNSGIRSMFNQMINGSTIDGGSLGENLS